ncbi:MAG: DUF4105 domain-containing protein [Bdellovibrionales bacterium]|nr:DUF4105 domain-containing protein [Bdellovibrionales bacterium]
MVLNRFLVFLFLTLIAPHSVWGFSLEQTGSYKKIALEKHLAENPQWLKLGHYHKTWTGNYHSKILGNFFLSPLGAENPEAELLTTIDQLFSADQSQLQCRYLGRMHWLKTVLPLKNEDLVTCTERDEWKKKLGAKEAYIIFAAGDLTSPGSSFGHTFLRLHNPENTQQKELLDYGVNYAALTGQDAGALYALKGLFGFYPGNFSMLPYHEKIREYTNLEGRDLWEYKLKLSESDVEFMVDHLLELDGSYSYYYFSDENCSYQILELINLVRPKMNLTQEFSNFVIPLDTVRLLNDDGFLESEKVRPSLQAEWRTRYAGLSLGEKKELRDAVKTPKEFKFTEKLSNKEKAEVLEASMSYMAIKEYREQKEFKDERYALAVQRAKLGQITGPMIIDPPASPLLSHRAMGAYFGYGSYDEKSYFSFKYRRAFHDLLSDDTGLSPFIHLEVLSLEFRYFLTSQNLDLTHFTFLNILSTSPTNILDHPVSWTVDIGTRPKLAPYFDFGAGSSFDVAQKYPTRWVFLGRMENRTEDSKYAGYAGAQALLMTKWDPHFRSLFGAKYLYSLQEHEFFWDNQFGISVSSGAHEVRVEYQNRHEISDMKGSYIYFF